VNPLFVTLWIAVGVAAVTWITSLITGEYSWVDRIWSIVPLGYVWVIAAGSGFANARLIMMAILVSLWGMRLTFNFARKGGYARGGEDYRWAYLRKGMPRPVFEVFNLVFIVVFQNGLLLLISLPAYVAFKNPTGLSWLDAVLALCFLGALVGETIADQQQWNFQQWKKAEVAAGRVPGLRFVQTGLFRFARHPNFFFEQVQWWLFFLMGCVAAGSVWQWTVVGPVLLTGLFIGSTRFTEQISRERYPEYAEYQGRVSALIPWFQRGARGVAVEQ